MHIHTILLIPCPRENDRKERVLVTTKASLRIGAIVCLSFTQAVGLATVMPLYLTVPNLEHLIKKPNVWLCFLFCSFVVKLTVSVAERLLVDELGDRRLAILPVWSQRSGLSADPPIFAKVPLHQAGETH